MSLFFYLFTFAIKSDSANIQGPACMLGFTVCIDNDDGDDDDDDKIW